uniref:Resolvase/invertase-type recombinase catalytic domain-containing protein n=1 Tax=uncultured marine group II/III euryarchaeote KM3_16_D12 TaxID=1457926 RepID=A0A075GLH7_9EURY|nr:hypothetical protein [uncultured marine group II/III euryarchaeote KM3_16_D12]
MSLMTVKDLKGAKKVIYLRISGREQAAGDKKKPKHKQQTFIEQLARVNQFLTDNGLGKATDERFIFREVQSAGKNPDMHRPILIEAIETAANLKGKVAFYVTEYSRFARHHLYGPAAVIKLYESDVPLVATDHGTIHGSPKRPTPKGNLILGIDMTMGGADLDTTRAKETGGRRARKELGIYHSTGLALWPFAKEDMIDWLRQNMHSFKTVSDGGEGKQAFKRRLAAIGGAEGPSGAWAVRAAPSLLQYAERLTPEEYTRWEAFRKRILALERAEGYDGARGVGDTSWLVKAIRYRFNGYLTVPWDEAFPEPNEAEWEEVSSNPVQFLSAADRKLRRSVVGKRPKSKTWSRK